MNKKLSEMSAGESGLVTRVTAEGRIKRRLFDMGVTPGAEVYSEIPSKSISAATSSRSVTPKRKP